MAITTTAVPDLIRSDVWNGMLKDILRDELIAQSFVRQVPSFQDGDRLHIPSVGDVSAQDYTENTQINFTPLTTGDWTLEIDQYKQTAHYATQKFLQDSYFASDVMAMLPRKQARAIAQAYESNVFAKPEAVFNTGANATATINGAFHRFAASGPNGELTPDDFAWAKNALLRANANMNNLICVVSQNVATRIERTLGNMAVNVNPMWDRVFREGAISGSRFLFNLYGFDIYVSNYVPTGVNTDNALPTYDGSSTVDFTLGDPADVALFFSNDPAEAPWLGSWRESPNVAIEERPSYRRIEISTTARWGVGVYRPETVVEVLVKPVV